MRNKLTFLAWVMLLWGSVAHAQIPVEVFGGHEKATVDIMFFKFFKNKEAQNTKWLFFNRNRASIDYRQTTTTFLPQFGFTEAISWNHPKLKGFAPVAVAQVLNSGVYTKAGIQFARVKPQWTVFSWLVSETKNNPAIDHFLLIRWTPPITKQLDLFAQAEALSVFPTLSSASLTFVQRARLGLQWGDFQFGAGLDLLQAGRTDYVKTVNAGAFIRHTF